jgi:redox-sensitive bicupin YhaK (pirin superfamily)
VIAGELAGIQGAAKTVTPVTLFDVRLKAGDNAGIAIPEGHNTAVVLLKGDVLVGDSAKLAGEARIAVLSRDGEGISLAATADSTLLILGGEPIEEPVASYGPFVMNTQQELQQAVQDYRAGKMGRLN